MTNTPLSRLADYTRAKASDDTLPDDEHELWAQITREIDTYCEPEPDVMADHPELFT